jgi:hypothetical protein
MCTCVGGCAPSLEDVHEMLPPRDIATQQISLFLRVGAQRPRYVHCGIQFSPQAALETRVLLSNAALAKTVRGDERWTYL